MGKQLIISVGREFGSGGHVIAEELARRFGLVLYDNNLLEQIAEEKEIPHDGLKKYDEKPKSRLFSRTVRGYSNSVQENLANMQFDYLKKKAADGGILCCCGTLFRDDTEGNARAGDGVCPGRSGCKGGTNPEGIWCIGGRSQTDDETGGLEQKILPQLLL